MHCLWLLLRRGEQNRCSVIVLPNTCSKTPAAVRHTQQAVCWCACPQSDPSLVRTSNLPDQHHLMLHTQSLMTDPVVTPGARCTVQKGAGGIGCANAPPVAFVACHHALLFTMPARAMWQIAHALLPSNPTALLMQPADCQTTSWHHV